MEVREIMRAKFGNLKKLFVDESALGVICGALGGITPTAITCLANLGVPCCGFWPIGNFSPCFGCCIPWFTDVFGGLCGGLIGCTSGILGDIGGIIIALASAGGDVTKMTSLFKF